MQTCSEAITMIWKLFYRGPKEISNFLGVKHVFPEYGRRQTGDHLTELAL